MRRRVAEDLPVERFVDRFERLLAPGGNERRHGQRPFQVVGFETVRAAYFGEEVMRVQRGRHEIKIMARLPESDRHSFADWWIAAEFGPPPAVVYADELAGLTDLELIRGSQRRAPRRPGAIGGSVLAGLGVLPGQVG